MAIQYIQFNKRDRIASQHSTCVYLVEADINSYLDEFVLRLYV